MSSTYNNFNNFGGPTKKPIQSLAALVKDLDLGVTGPTGCSGNDFSNLQNLIDNCCGTSGSICDAINAGSLTKQVPFSCMIDLIQNYSTCGTDIPADKRQQAYNAFITVTGYEPLNMNQVFDILYNENLERTQFNSFYFYIPVLILYLVGIWIMVIFSMLAWPMGLFLTVAYTVILLGFALAYDTHLSNYFKGHNDQLQTLATQSQQNFQNSLAYWNQGFFAAACAVTCPPGSTGCWLCNDPNSVKSVKSVKPCVPCNNTTTTKVKANKGFKLSDYEWYLE